MREEKYQELGRPWWLLEEVEAREAEPKRQVGKPKAARESDQPIVL
jgi:hypothetical protein